MLGTGKTDYVGVKRLAEEKAKSQSAAASGAPAHSGAKPEAAE